MHISLRARLDTARDRFVLEFEGNTTPVASMKPIAIEGMKEPAQLELDADGYIVSLSIPGLSKGLAALAGEKPAKPAR